MTAGAPAPTPPEIRLVDLAKHFRDVRAVDDVSLDIRAGEFFSLLGPSGCGKTTTLRMIGGFELPTAGRIQLRGRDVTNDPPDKRPVNMVFQNYALFPHLDVANNVAFGLKRRNVAEGRDGRRVGEALELVHLTGYGEAQAEPAVRWPAAARRPRPGPRQPAQRAAPRRTARRPRPQAPPPAPGRAQAHPDRGRDHVRLRDPRPGRGAHHERPDRGHARAARSSSWARPRSSTSGRRRGSWPTSSASTNLLRGPVEGGGRVRLTIRGYRARSPTTGWPRGTEIEISIRPGGDRLVPTAAEGAIGRDRPAGRLSRFDHLVSRSHDGRARPDRHDPQDRGSTPGRQ